MGLPSEAYALCWAPETSGAVADFTQTVDAHMRLIGPAPAHLLYTLSFPCNLQLAGYGLAATNAIVVLSSGRCPAVPICSGS